MPLKEDVTDICSSWCVLNNVFQSSIFHNGFDWNSCARLIVQKQVRILLFLVSISLLTSEMYLQVLMSYVMSFFFFQFLLKKSAYIWSVHWWTINAFLLLWNIDKWKFPEQVTFHIHSPHIKRSEFSLAYYYLIAGVSGVVLSSVEFRLQFVLADCHFSAIKYLCPIELQGNLDNSVHTVKWLTSNHLCWCTNSNNTLYLQLR